MNASFKRIILILVIISTAVLLISQSAFSQEKREHYLIFSDPNRVVIYDADSLSVTKEIPFTAKNIAENSSLSMDRKYLAINDLGDISSWSGKVKHPGKIVIIDMESHEVRATLNVGWMPIGFYFAPYKDILYVLNYGKDSKNPLEFNSTLSVVNLETMTIDKTIKAGAKIEFVTFGPQGDYFYVVTGGDQKKEKKRSQLLGINTATNEIEINIELNWEARQIFFHEPSNLLYILCGGVPKDKQDKYVEGSLHIVDLVSKSVVAELKVGCDPLRLMHDDEKDLFFVLSHKSPLTPQKDIGTLFTIADQKIHAEITLSKDPYTLRSDDKRRNYYVACKGKLLVLNDDCSQVLYSVSFEQGNPFKDLVISPNNTKAYLLQHNTTHVKAFDLTKDTKVAHDINVGRQGVKFGKFLGAVAATMVSYYAGYATASATGSGYFFYNIYGVAPPSTELFISPNYKHTYIFNTQSNDVTIVDYNTDAVIRYEKPLDGGGRLLLLSSDEKKLIFLADKSYNVIDLDKNTVLAQKKFHAAKDQPFYNFFPAPAENEIYLPTKSGFYVFNKDQLKVLKDERSKGTLVSVFFSRMPGDDIMKQAAACIDKEDFDRAEKLLTVHLEKNPEDATAHFFYALVKEKQKNTDSAVSEYKQAVQYDPDFVEAYLGLGNLYLELEKADLAFDSYQKAGSLLYASGDFQKCIDCYSKMLTIKADDIDTMMKLAACYEKHNLTLEAIDTYQNIIELDSQNELALLQQTILLIKKNQTGRAEENVQRLLTINPANHLAIHQKGVIHLLKNEKEQAIESFIKCTEIDTDYLPSYSALANAYYESEEFEKALPHFEKAVELGAHDYDTYYKLGHVYLSKNTLDQAEKYLKEAGVISFMESDYEKSAEMFQKILQFDSQNTAAHTYLARIYYEKGEKEEAMKELALCMDAKEIDWQIISPLVNNIIAESKEDYQALGLEAIPESVDAIDVPVNLKIDATPEVLIKVNFEFPEGIQKDDLGIMIFKLSLDKKGNVEEVTSVRSKEEVEKIIADTLKKWVYQVTTLNGSPVRATFAFAIDFAKEE